MVAGAAFLAGASAAGSASAVGFDGRVGCGGASIGCVPEKSDGEVGSVRSVKSIQSARTTSCAESSACVVIEASGRLRSESATSISSLASTHRTVPGMRSFFSDHRGGPGVGLFDLPVRRAR